MWWTALVMLAAAGGQATPPTVDVTRVGTGAAVLVAEIDVGKLKGDLRRLAWSADGREFYLQTAEADSRLGWKLRHYVVAAGGQPRGVNEEPAWASAYWRWKSGQAAPGQADWKIDVDQQSKRVSATATPMAGNAARGEIISGTGISVEEAAGVAQQTQNANTFTLRLKGQVIGEFVNEPAVPGLTFGWGPARSGLVAFASPSGRLVLMDEQGRTSEVADTKAVVLPGFSHDGARIAWLEKTGRKKYVLRAADLSTRRP